MFLLMMPILLRWFDLKTLMVFGLMAWVVRYILFAYGFSESGAIVPMMILGIIVHGVCYDFFNVSAQIYVNRVFKPSARARAQAFLATVTYGAGTFTGTSFAGFVYHATKLPTAEQDWSAMWLVPAGIAVVLAVVFASGFRERRSESCYG